MTDVEAPTPGSGTECRTRALEVWKAPRRWHQAPATHHNSFICKLEQSPGIEAQTEQGLYSFNWYLQPEQRMWPNSEGTGAAPCGVNPRYLHTA